MAKETILEGKRILIVDDEPDVLETLQELLHGCLIDTAPDFVSGKKFLTKNPYDIAIFDIMGVKGYELLRIAIEKGIPALMLTAHALSPENLIKSIKEGAHSYIPKEKLGDIALFIQDVLEVRQKGLEKHGRWFARLKPFFDKEFGEGWRDKDREFWDSFDRKWVVGKKDLEGML
ncbi:MAG: response regulator [Deltaproteobacteria bacterium]|nr:response regulator [Deltaproteobacteria bacterium]